MRNKEGGGGGGGGWFIKGHLSLFACMGGPEIDDRQSPIADRRIEAEEEAETDGSSEGSTVEKRVGQDSIFTRFVIFYITKLGTMSMKMLRRPMGAYGSGN